MRPFHRPLLPVCVIFLASAAAAEAPEFSAGRFIEEVKFLASPEMRGRATGSRELEKAAEYIAGQFRAIGLKAPSASGYLQPFSVTTNARLGNGNHFEFVDGNAATTLKLNEDFLPFNFSSRGKVSGHVVFAGYGITAPEYNYDDYAGLDVTNKLVLILRHEPQEYDEKSVFSGRVYTEHSQFFSKAVNAKMHGARGVILINDQANHHGDADEMEKFGRTVGPTDVGIPFVQIKAEIAVRWARAAGKDLDELASAIDTDLKPRSFALPETLEVRETVDVERIIKTVHNVAGYLPGQTGEYLIIGAHFDHLGLGEQFSMAPSLAGTIHPGADDNASGTAGVIELARWFAAQPKQARGVLFLAFAGEELGLLGSSYYVNHPELPLEKAVAMINLDMIGRVREGKLYIGGTGTGTTLKALVEPVFAKYSQLHFDYSDTTGYGSSDHTSFTTKQVPVLFFFSGLHGDYHKPSDTWDKIEGPETVQVLTVVGEIGEKLRETPERPQFVRVKEPGPAHGDVAVAGTSASGGGGYGPDFGSIPDFADVPKGVRFADIREGSPAAEAGLRGGDILIEFDGKPIGNLYDFTYALRSKKPGDQVTVKVLRNGSPIEAKVLLRKRK